MTGDVTLREATAQDAARVAQVWEGAWRDAHVGHIPDELLAHRTTRSFVDRTPAMLDRTVVAEVDGEMIRGGTATVDYHRYEL